MDQNRLQRQIEFLVEIDKLKEVCRQTLLMNGRRYENDAEHSWHLAVMVLLLSEYSATPGLDLLRVMKMVAIHDLVEIDAGDTYCYDEVASRDKAEREHKAAKRIFSLLPADQASEVASLWGEFEAMSTAEAKFAAALDRLQPLLHNYYTQGAAWRKHGITRRQVRERNRHMAEGAPALWAYAEELIRDAVRRGYLAAD